MVIPVESLGRCIATWWLVVAILGACSGGRSVHDADVSQPEDWILEDTGTSEGCEDVDASSSDPSQEATSESTEEGLPEKVSEAFELGGECAGTGGLGLAICREGFDDCTPVAELASPLLRDHAWLRVSVAGMPAGQSASLTVRANDTPLECDTNPCDLEFPTAQFGSGVRISASAFTCSTTEPAVVASWLIPVFSCKPSRAHRVCVEYAPWEAHESPTGSVPGLAASPPRYDVAMLSDGIFAIATLAPPVEGASVCGLYWTTGSAEEWSTSPLFVWEAEEPSLCLGAAGYVALDSARGETHVAFFKQTLPAWQDGDGLVIGRATGGQWEPLFALPIDAPPVECVKDIAWNLLGNNFGGLHLAVSFDGSDRLLLADRAFGYAVLTNTASSWACEQVPAPLLSGYPYFPRYDETSGSAGIRLDASGIAHLAMAGFRGAAYCRHEASGQWLDPVLFPVEDNMALRVLTGLDVDPDGTAHMAILRPKSGTDSYSFALHTLKDGVDQTSDDESLESTFTAALVSAGLDTNRGGSLNVRSDACGHVTSLLFAERDGESPAAVPVQVSNLSGEWQADWLKDMVEPAARYGMEIPNVPFFISRDGDMHVFPVEATPIWDGPSRVMHWVRPCAVHLDEVSLPGASIGG